MCVRGCLGFREGNGTWGILSADITCVPLAQSYKDCLVT